MTEENKLPSEDTPKQPNGGRPYLTIALGETGEVVVTGSIGDRITAYGLLLVAHDEIENFHREANKPKIQSGGIMNFMRNGKRH